MPAEITAKPDLNADLANLQTLPGGVGKPEIDPESADALDALFKEETEKQENQTNDEIAAKKKADEETAKKAKEKEGENVKAGDLPKGEEDKVAKKAAEEAAEEAARKVAEEAAAAAKKDEFDAIELPPHSKPKATESFEKVKVLAREKISAAEKERNELREKLSKAEAAVKGGLPDEVQKELEELRAFRQKMDVEADPSFKTWDIEISSTTEAIYDKLKANGFTEEHIKRIKDLGGPGEVDWDKIKDRIPDSVRRYLDTKIVNLEELAEKKVKAIAAAKKNASEFLATRQKEVEATSETFVKEATSKYEELVPKMEWLVEKTAAKDAPPAEKAAIEAHNKLVKEAKEDAAAAIADESPNMRAYLTIGWLQLKKLRVEHDALKAISEAKISTLEKDLAEKVAFIEKIKKSGTPRLRDSSAPEGKISSSKPGHIDLSEDGASALDRLHAEVTAGKE